MKEQNNALKRRFRKKIIKMLTDDLIAEVQAYLDDGGKAHDKTPDGIDFVYWGCRKVYIANGRAYRLKAEAKKEHTQ